MNQKDILAAYKAGRLSIAEVKQKLLEIQEGRIAIPLSEGQRGLWFLFQMAPENSAYNIPLCFRFTKGIDLGVLKEAFFHVREQFPILKSVFLNDQGIPFQIIEPNQPLPFEEEDISLLKSSEVLAYLKQTAKHPFSLEQGPLMRIHFFHCSAKEGILLLIFHHLIFDGVSMLNFTTALFNAYRDLLQNIQPVFLSTPTTFRDFVIWEQKMMESEEGRAHLSYWEQKLSPPIPHLELPTDFPRLSLQTLRGQTIVRELDLALSARVKAFALSQNVPMSVTFLAIFKALLYRYTNQDDIIIGMASLGRPEKRFDALVGFFTNMLPIRSQGMSRQTFSVFIKELALTVVDALDHGVYPLPALIKKMNIERTQGSSPLFQAAYLYQNFFHFATKIQVGEGLLEAERIEEVRQEGEFELCLEVYEKADRIALNFNYNPDLFSPSRIEQMVEHYIIFLKEAITNPNLHLEKYSLLSSEEQNQILLKWNNTQLTRSHTKCIHHFFEEKAFETPTKTAVTFGADSLNYEQLEKKSSYLASYLQKLGVGPDKLVAICVERSLEMVIGIIGILRAGGGYVPFDPNCPKNLLDQMLEDSKTEIILTQSNLAHLFSTSNRRQKKVILLDRDWRKIVQAATKKSFLKREVRPENLAYVIYTSGSTGKPKGVMVEHRSIVNTLSFLEDNYPVVEGDAYLLKTNYIFDVSLSELFGWFIGNGGLIILPMELEKSPQLFAEYIKKQQITHINFVPSLLNVFLNSVDDRTFAAGGSLKYIMVAGEAFPRGLVEKAVRFFPQGVVENIYGPTETSIYATWFSCSRNKGVHLHTPIGKPISNTQVYILDQEFQPLPIGFSGELHIAGDGLARGYWNNPELTKQKFIDNPFTPGTKLYKTGDLARWLPSGQIEYLGRLDHQVKIRGFRIELGAIDNHVMEYAGILESVTIVKQQKEHKKLVTYYVPQQKTAGLRDLSKELREYLQSRLPDYMIPSHFIVVSQLPLTPNGKIDRKELERKEIVIAKETPSSAPYSALEEKILSIWQNLLQVKDIGIEEGFFDVGGDSLLAVAVVEKIKQELQCQLTVTELFTYPNIRSLSKHLDKQEKVRNSRDDSDASQQDESSKDLPDYCKDSVAVIGISCQFPEAKDRYEFWKNIQSGQESVQFFTKEELFDLGFSQTLIDNPKYVPARSSLEGKDLFDPEFFHLSPKDAEMMDPQLRLLLLHSWKAIEDAGYAPKTIPDTSVYMSASNNSYQALLRLADGEILANSDSYVAWVLSQSGTIPTMISHKLGLKGPSYFVHSNCSSSLVGLSNAFQSLQAGKSRYALVGATTLHASSGIGYVHQPGMNFSSDGHIKAFDAAADGMIGGEGVAVILLKNALDAVREGDHIYGILRGVAINNDGAEKAGFYAPSVQGQQKVIEEVLRTTGIDPLSIQYVEAHGTGTKLGDPIELAALSGAYQSYTDKKQFCGIGSVKTNIGHLDTAAGLAGCIKVLLSLSNLELVPTLHYKTSNPQLDLANTPFYVVDTNEKLEKGKTHRAALSSFGVGGTNGHAIFEQYIASEKPRYSQAPYIIPLSAKNAQRLRAYVEEFIPYLEEYGKTQALENIAYTLQVGREAMGSRALFIVETLDQLKEQLVDFLAGKEPAKNENFDVQSIEKWIRGEEVDWSQHYEGGKPDKVSLPTYSFAKKRYWPQGKQQEVVSVTHSDGRLHPMVHQNISTLAEQKFSSTFTGAEYFIAEHVIQGETIVPAVVTLEMARAAVIQATGDYNTFQSMVRLINVVWVQPIVVNQNPVEVHLAIYPESEGKIHYKMHGALKELGQPPLLYNQGTAEIGPVGEDTFLDLKEIQKQCSQQKILAKQFYEGMIGANYGPRYKAVTEVYVGHRQLVAKLSLPPVVSDGAVPLQLHPSILDGAFQAAEYLQNIARFQLLSAEGKPFQSAIPFALQELQIISPTVAEMWVYVRFTAPEQEKDALQKVDIELGDSQGKVCVRIKGFSIRELEEKTSELSNETLLLEPFWKEEKLEKREEPIYTHHVVFLCEIGQERDIESQLAGIEVLILNERSNSVDQRFTRYAKQLLAKLQSILSRETKGQILFQLIISPQGEKELFSGLYGLLQTGALENSRCTSQMIEIESTEAVVEKIKENRQRAGSHRIRYEKNTRYMSGWKEAADLKGTATPWREDGVYLITGGAGGLGLIFAREILARAKNATLILTGRSASTNGPLEPNMVYKQLDATDQAAVQQFITTIQETYGNLHGIIHAAGIIQDNYIHKKTEEELAAVLAPKVTGLRNLDLATKEIPLDFLLLFSSISGILGSPGQADYSVANGFLNAYAEYRNRLVASKKRFGKCLSINWPLWKEGGMQVDAPTKEMLLQNLGFIPMETKQGIGAFYQGWLIDTYQIMVVSGKLKDIKLKLFPEERAVLQAVVSEKEVDDLVDKLKNVLRTELFKLLKIKSEDIDDYAQMAKYGLDSISMIEFINTLNQKYKLGLIPTVFFEYPTLQDFAQFLVKEYRSHLLPHFCVEPSPPTKSVATERTRQLQKSAVPKESIISARNLHRDAPEPIAIIGISGAFPMAEDVDAYWNNLEQGKDCITEIPLDRWDWKDHSGDPATEPNKTRVRWGGFLHSVAEFDPLFFGISPREAELMDPQLRLSLTHVWKALEDAGYTSQKIDGTQTAVFIGTGNTGYSSLVAQGNRAIDGSIVANMGPSAVPNRISYILNIHGPSEPIDTACSSSLVAIHHAVLALEHGNCEMAIAGGVNTILLPEVYIAFDKAGALSQEGKCKTFSDRADGFVHGEGVAVLLLKKLSQAEKEGDHIYGVIRSSAVNHGGHANSSTTPNPKAQADLLVAAYQKSNIDLRTVSYIEAHGTGTELGDPIEIRGLISAFKELNVDPKLPSNYCGLGSVKTNIGHLSLAAGVASVIKVLLQLKHKTLVKSLYSETINPYIQLKDTPFYIVQEKQHWKAIQDARGFTLPRRAGVSSFGIGGVNAHVVIEEYIPAEERKISTGNQNPAIILLSAKNEKQLKARVEQLIYALEIAKYNPDDLLDIAYTLQIGRDPMEERLGLIAPSIEQLHKKLKDFVAGQDNIPDLYRGKSDKGFLQKLLAGEEMQEAIIKWMERQRYTKLLELWVRGLDIDWEKLDSNRIAKKISLPTYPFAKDHYWVEKNPSSLGQGLTNYLTPFILHPLLHQNTSNIFEQKFRSAFSGEEFFLKEHVIKGQRVLPGVAHLEIAREALLQSGLETGVIKLKNIVWIRPVFLEKDPITIDIRIYPQNDGSIAYKISQDLSSKIYARERVDRPRNSQEEESENEIIYSQGIGEILSHTEAPKIDLAALQAQSSASSFSVHEMYVAYKAIGFDYGPAFCGIKKIYVGENFILAQTFLSSDLLDTKGPYVLHPGMMDAALQVSSLLVGTQENQLMLPFALGEIEIHGKCAPSMWVYARMSEKNEGEEKIQRRNIDLCDEAGNIAVRIKDLSFRAAEEPSRLKPALLFESIWKEQAFEKEESAEYVRHLVWLCEIPLREDIHLEMSPIEVYPLNEPGDSIDHRFTSYAKQILANVQSVLKDGPRESILMQLVFTNEGEKRIFGALGGLLKTAALENSYLTIQVIALDSPNEILEKLRENKKKGGAQTIQYQGNKRYVAEWKEILPIQPPPFIPWKEDGVYLITGGAKGLGLIFAQEIKARAKNAKLILLGRSPSSIGDLGDNITYKQVDIADQEAVDLVLKNISHEYGVLNGIIHAAGVVKDNYIRKKTEQELEAVFAPKVMGTAILDKATRDIPLDFFVLFSSATGSVGGAGQADYASANAFMDAYSIYRNQLVELQQRHGKTLSIQWPLWKEGGMKVHVETEKMLLQNIGIAPVETKKGLEAFYNSFSSQKSTILVMERGLQESKRAASKPLAKVEKISTEGVDLRYLFEKVLLALKNTVAALLKIKGEEIDNDKEFQQYGFDSITLTEWTNLLNKQFNLKLAPTLFFEWPTLSSFASYLMKEQAESMISHFLRSPAVTGPEKRIEKQVEISSALIQNKDSRFFRSNCGPLHPTKLDVNEPIAIIGISAVFPMAENIDLFWKNLEEEKDCITEIPRGRWDWREYYGDPVKETNKTNVKWGGFIDSVAEFDPLFFGISPKEAEIMDPQQRLALTHVWKAIEDAGYCGQSLSGSNTAIFLGIGNTGYSSLIAKSGIAIEGTTAANMSPSVGPNRISYFLNIHGPSEPIDTACSSSLVAIHHAMEALQRDDCKMAITGGVNTIVAPEGHIAFDKAGALSKEGKCKTFSDRADGFAVGEGAGIVVLKKLRSAEQDGDHIYGVIRSSSVNHGGKANSLTTPNPKAQADLLINAYTKSGIDPKTVTYIETHGTGTPLGDPIEINGLKAAFRELSQHALNTAVAPSSCGLGSVKTNIGHLSLAAGAASLVKVLLQFKYKTLVKSLHSETINPYIQLEGTPFYIVQKTQPWVALKDAQGKELPRRAGISSFGIGGVNAHIVLEEYRASESSSVSIEPNGPVMIILSAKNEKQLSARVEQLYIAIHKSKYTNADLVSISYTLQIGRDAMEERIGFLAASIEQLEEKLRRFTQGEEEIEEFYRGRVEKGTLQKMLSDEEMQEAVVKWIKQKKLLKLIEFWVHGLPIEWAQLYQEYRPRKISLPAYPFAKELYWIDTPSLAIKKQKTRIFPKSILHPFLHENISDLTEQRFSATFRGEEFFFKDHEVQGNKIWPAVAYLEMAREAAVQAIRGLKDSQRTVCIKNAAWVQPIAIQSEPIQVFITITPDLNSELIYEIYSGSGAQNGEKKVHHHGRISLSSAQDKAQVLDLRQCAVKCGPDPIFADECYELFTRLGIKYGPRHQCIQQLYIGKGEVLAKLSLDSALFNEDPSFVLHPSLVDSALQASVGLKFGSTTRELSLPFALEELQIFGPCVPNMWAYVRKRYAEKVEKLDIDLCDDQGTICARFTGICSRLIKQESQQDGLIPSLLLTPVWVPFEYSALEVSHSLLISTIVLGGNKEDIQVLQESRSPIQLLDIHKDEKIEMIAKKLGPLDLIKEIIWIAPSELNTTDFLSDILESQEEGILKLFNLIKALLFLGLGDRELHWTLITRGTQLVLAKDVVNPAHAGVHGLVGSMAKEYPNWKVRLIDLAADSPSVIPGIFMLPTDPEGNTYAYRNREWFKQTLMKTQYNHRSTFPASLYKPGGVYIVIGGAGGIGEVWSEYVMRTYQARVIWIGRRKIDSIIQDKIDRLESIGPRPLYIQADATNRESLQKAYKIVKRLHPNIHGVIHSAIVLKDSSLANMDSLSFKKVLEAKLHVSVNIAKIFKKEELDFVTFFSSMQSYAKAAGQSNYASGCTFKDAFAHRLKNEWPCAVKVINWGYWGSVGIVSSEAYRKRMAQAGIGSIEPEEAMETLELLLSGPLHQIALIKKQSLDQATISSVEETIEIYPEELNSNIKKLQEYNLITL